MEASFFKHIAQFWRAVEHLSCFAIPKAGRRGVSGEIIFALEDGSILPWSSEHPIRRSSSTATETCTFTVYLGVFQLEAVREMLESSLRQLPVEFGERLAGDSALATFKVSNDGQFIPESFELSACAFGLGRFVSSYPRVLEIFDGYEELSRQLGHVMEGLLWSDDGGSRPVAIRDLVSLCDKISRTIKWPSVAWKSLATVVVHIGDASRELHERERLTSTALKSLSHMVSRAEESRLDIISRVVRERPENDDDRIDLSVDRAYVLDTIAPQLLPRSAWPRPSILPSLSESFALSYVLRTVTKASEPCSITALSQASRTSILREIVAHILSERAAVLASFRSSKAILVGEERLSDGRRVHLLDVRLYGFEAVFVAPSSRRAIGMVRAFEAEGIRGEKRVISAFVGSVDNISSNRAATSAMSCVTDAVFGVAKRSQNHSARPWPDACDRFRTSTEQVESLLSAPTAAYAMVTDRELARAEVDQVRSEVERTERDIEASQLGVKAFEAELIAAEKDLEARREGLERLRNSGPGLVQMVVSLGSEWRTWSGEVKAARAALDEQEDVVFAAREKVLRASDSLARARSRLNLLRARVEEARHKWMAYSRAVEELKERSSFVIGDTDLLRSSGTDSERSSPWLTDDIQGAREAVFAEALEIHDVLMDEVGPALFENAALAIDLLAGALNDSLSPQATRSALASLFLLVPVITLSAEQCHRILSIVGSGAVGWLCVDDAGSIPPQVGVPLLQMGERSIALGHQFSSRRNRPNVLPSLSEMIRQQAGVERAFIGQHASLQSVLDRVSSVGHRVGDRWLSPIIETEREMSAPIVSMLNDCAFDGAFVSSGGLDGGPNLPQSAWYDVEGDNPRGHYVFEEGEVVDALLYALGEHRWSTRIVTPFADVAIGLRKRFWEADVLDTIFAVSEMPEDATDITIFVLGGDPSYEAAFEWACESPAIVTSVLASTKRRVYVVGSHAQWSARPYFSALAKGLPLKSTHDRPQRVRFGTRGTALLLPKSA